MDPNIVPSTIEAMAYEDLESSLRQSRFCSHTGEVRLGYLGAQLFLSLNPGCIIDKHGIENP